MFYVQGNYLRGSILSTGSSTALYVGGASYSPVCELRGSGQLSRAVDDMHLQCKLSS